MIINIITYFIHKVQHITGASNMTHTRIANRKTAFRALSSNFRQVLHPSSTLICVLSKAFLIRNSRHEI